MAERLHHFIGGQKITASARHGEVFNPATGELVAEVPFADTALVDRTVKAANAAFAGWAATPPLQRARVMFRFKEQIEKHIGDMAAAITREHGKVLDDAKGSITRGLEVVEFACGIPHLLKGEFTENVGTNVDSYSVRQPLGVCAGITPFNFPAMVPLWMFPVALACGNAFILKPSEIVPSASLMMAELLMAAG
ncbi:MAG: aldehyde dehydrogenase family protein, partial [Alphaproteobacteria bacterium]